MQHPPNQLLRIDASSRHEGSMSRALGDAFVELWSQRGSAGRLVQRDLALTPPPHIDSLTISSFFSSAEARQPAMAAATVLSDSLIDEIRLANDVLITTPMYNFGIPSALKAWLDQVVRIGETFAFDGQHFTGLLQGKTAHVAIAYGAAGYGPGGAFAGANFVEPYLRFILGFMGFATVHVYAVESTSIDAAAAAADLARARTEMAAALGAGAGASQPPAV